MKSSAPTRLILIRHGETAWNLERRLQGHTDIALNDEGLRQAGALGLALAGQQIDAVFASDLLRASQSAHAIASHHALKVVCDKTLRERCYGAFEGLLYSEIEQRYPREFAAWQARAIDACMPPGVRAAETFRQFYARVLAALLRLAEHHPGHQIAVVAHGGVLECAYRAALKLALDTPRNFAVKNASLNRFMVEDGQLRLMHWGDVSHLEAKALDELP